MVRMGLGLNYVLSCGLLRPGTGKMHEVENVSLRPGSLD